MPKPTDIHLLVGEQLREAGILASHITPQGYAHLRVLAEEKARAAPPVSSGSSEVTLEEIHDLLEPAIATKSLQGLAAITELQIERENVFADARLAAYLHALVGELPRHVIIVSDTYFSGEQVRSLLGQTQLRAVPFASVHTSSDAGTGKGADLWEHVLQELGHRGRPARASG